MTAAGPKLLAALCSSAVVELVLNKPRALLLSPCDRQASTAPVNIQYTELEVRVSYTWIISECFKTQNRDTESPLSLHGSLKCILFNEII